MADVRIIKFDVGSPTDVKLGVMQARLGAASRIEAMTRSLAIAQRITDLTDSGKPIYVEMEPGMLRAIVIS